MKVIIHKDYPLKRTNFFPMFSVVESVDSSAAQSISQPVSPATSIIRQQPAVKKRKVSKGDEIDDMLMRSLKDIQERQNKRSGTDTSDGETHFGNHVAATLRRLTPKQQAIAKLQIDQILLNVEFPCEPYTHPPSNYYDHTQV